VFFENLAFSANANQGDQIGRVFAHWVIVYFGQWFGIDKSSARFWATFLMVPVMYCLHKKCVGPHFGRLFHKSILSPFKQMPFKYQIMLSTGLLQTTSANNVMN
jgi:hypothetical protein